MKHLSPNLEDVAFRVSGTRRLFLFLDYDGTLAPITDEPRKAALPPYTRRVLKRLANNKRVVLSVVSGRMLKQVKNLVNIGGIYYAGCHGLEMERLKNTRLISGLSGLKKKYAFIKRGLKSTLKDIQGWMIEDKGMVLTLHYRRVAPKKVRALKDGFYSVVKPCVRNKGVAVAGGKKVLEIRPCIEWDKGKYCLYLMDRLKYKRGRDMPVYIGDDKTDESAFKVLRKRGVTIFVRGEKKTSSAEYYLCSTDEVTDFLSRLTRYLR